MAKLKPSDLPEDVRNEPFRSAEITFFDAAKYLPQNWFVLYGVTWYLKVKNNTWSEGEADFVIISPETGIVVIEIKGGRIGRDDAGWYSVDRNDEKHRIKDPALQAAQCKHNLLRYIRNIPGFSDRFLPARHMVCFPNVSENDAPNLIELPREMQILSEDFATLDRAILDFSNRNYDTDSDGKNTRLTPKECSKIVNILKPNFDCPNRWSVQAHKQDVIMNELTEDQSYLWNIIEGNNRVSLSGPAGSGKTIMALKLIDSIIKNGGTVLVLLPSIALQYYYRAVIKNSQMVTRSYNTDNMDFQKDDKVYSLVVIDEAQDISEDQWLRLYEEYRIEDALRFLCIFDSNQRLTKQGMLCPMEHLIPLRLSKVLRNTRQIGEFSTKFYSGDKECMIVGPDGPQVQYSGLPTAEQIHHEILSLIEHYVFDEGFDYSDIVVLFTDNKKNAFKKEINKGNRLGITFRGIPGFEHSYAHKAPIILAESVYRFRGLESKVVILTGLDGLDSAIMENACYIGASRARNVLHIVAEDSTVVALKKRGIC